MELIRGAYGVAIPANSALAQRWPIGLTVTTRYGVKMIAGYSSHAFEGISAVWLCDGPLLNTENLQRCKVEDLELDDGKFEVV